MTYSEFRSNIFQCLTGNDDDCVGYDTIIEFLKNNDPDQASQWFKQVMIDWNELRREEN